MGQDQSCEETLSISPNGKWIVSSLGKVVQIDQIMYVKTQNAMQGGKQYIELHMSRTINGNPIIISSSDLTKEEVRTFLSTLVNAGGNGEELKKPRANRKRTRQ